MDKININNLSGKCLAAMPSVDGVFAKSLVYVCSHNAEGAMGFVVNKLYEGIKFNELSFGSSFNNSQYLQIPVFQGGPLEKEKGFIMHDESYDSDSCFNIGSGIKISSSSDILHDITLGKGPKNFMIVLGYAGWMPNQLENEISQNLWVITQASPELIFNTPIEDRWSLALSSLGINDSNFYLPLGHS